MCGAGCISRRVGEGAAAVALAARLQFLPLREFWRSHGNGGRAGVGFFSEGLYKKDDSLTTLLYI